MELIRTWILSLTVAAILIAVAEALMPPGSVKRAAKLTAGLILILALLQPLVKMNYGDLLELVEAIPVGAVSQEENSASELYEGIIEEELGAYIAEKGLMLGITCTAEVVCTPDETGVPIPERVTVRGDLTAEQKKSLSDCIETELGIGREGQMFCTGENFGHDGEPPLGIP